MENNYDYEAQTLDWKKCPDCGSKLIIEEKEWIAENQYQWVETCEACGYQETEYN